MKTRRTTCVLPHPPHTRIVTMSRAIPMISVPLPQHPTHVLPSLVLWNCHRSPPLFPHPQLLAIRHSRCHVPHTAHKTHGELLPAVALTYRVMAVRSILWFQ